MSMTAHLMEFESVSASIGGVDLSSIAELSLTASANGIPQITLLVDVGSTYVGANTGYVSTVSLKTGAAIVSELRSMVKTSGATLSLSLTCRDITGGETQTLSLSGWLLTDVGLSPVQIGGVSMASVTCMHPICKAHFGGAVPGLMSAPPKLEDVSGDNPLDVFLSALKAYADVYREAPVSASVDGGSSTEAVRSALIDHLDTAISSLESSVSWKSGGLPAASQLGGWGDYIVDGLSAYGLPGHGPSVFGALAGVVVPECSLAIGGDYTAGSLEIGPFEPWAESDITIDDADIVSLTFPQNDPTPISGVQIALLATESDSITTFQPIPSQIPGTGKPAEAYYVPECELNAEFMYGPIQQFMEPGWLAQAAFYAKTGRSSAVSDSNLAQDDNLVTATTVGRSGDASFGGGGGDDVPAEDYAAAALACGKAFFETSFMKDYAFTINARLLFSSSGGIICPGRVLTVTSGGKTVLGGYITSVTHTVSVASRSAHTSITCTHPRFDGVLPEQISGGTNALYS